MHTDPARPLLHFTAARGWINDPLGLTHHHGLYHLFFQQVPDRTVWATEQHWGHATSPDLMHWTEHEPALAPGDGDDGVWSGSVVVPPDGGPAALFYTSVTEVDSHVGRARLARPADPSWRTWVKGDVVARLPEDLDVVAYRDPYVVHDGTSWLMLMGAGLTDGTATALTYRSADLETWEYAGPLHERHASQTEPVWTGTAWECPQLVPLGDRWVLVVSVWDDRSPGDQVYAVGDLVDGRFHPESWHQLSWGGSLYAGSAYADADGRRGLVHWLREVLDEGGRWAGAHSVPHLLELHGDRVVATPHPNLLGARHGAPRTLAAGGGTLPLGSPVDVEWSTAPGAVLRLADDRGPAAQLEVDGDAVVVRAGTRTCRVPLAGSQVRVLLDGPVLEVFTTGGVLGAPVRVLRDGAALVASGPGAVVVHEVG